MICPKCGENNPANFRFCGMCGAVLETSKAAAPKPATPPKPAAPKTEPPRSGDVPVALRIAANPARASSEHDQVPLSGGPSFLGLGGPAPSGPSVETVRGAFSGSSPTFVYEDPKTGRGRTVILLFVLLILIAGVWVRYHYLAFVPHVVKPQATPTANNSSPATSDQQSQPANTQQNQTTAANTPPAQHAAPPTATTPEKPAEDAAKNEESAPKETASAKPDTETPSPPKRTTARSEASTRAATPVAATKPIDTGDGAFRRGDAYLYGRGGVSENCAEAIKNLKAASASGNAKARSAFGTMYATGHCVPRDLPTSYSWFAKALQADPNNQILEKDLTAVWNQMTPPERQLATKLKQ